MRMLGMQEIPDAVSAILIIIYSIAYIASLERKPACRKHIHALTVGFLFRIALLLFDLYGRSIYQLPNSGGDSEAFYRYSVSFAGGGADWGAFTIVMGYLFRFCGVSRLFGQFMLTLCSVVSIECAAKIFDLVELDDRRKGIAMWIICLLPNFAILSVIYLRESIVTMCISVSLLQYILWVKKKGNMHLLLAVAFSMLGAIFHSGAIAVSVGYILSLLLYNNKTGHIQFKFTNVAAFLLILLMFVFVLNSSIGEKFLGKFKNLESVEDVASGVARGNSTYVQYVGDSSSISNMVIYTIPRMFFFLYSPMPWMIRGLSDIIAFCFSSCFYIYTTYRVISYLISKRTENRELVILIFIVCLCAAFVFGWGTSTSGTACRHRDKMTIVWGVLMGLTLKPDKRKETPSWLA